MFSHENIDLSHLPRILAKKMVNLLPEIVFPGFVHIKGAHCESKSLQDLLNWAGFQVSEPLVFGLDATLGFAFIDNVALGTQGMVQDFLGGMPFFVGGKQGTITKNSLACRVLGATCEEQVFTSAEKAWNSACDYLTAGQPLVACVDMYYLPYHTTYHQFHFGRHTVVLAGYNANQNIVLVADVEFADLQEIPVADLQLARGSPHGGKFMAAHNTQFIIQARPDGKHPPLAAGAKLAIQQVVKNMLAASMSHEGLSALQKFARSIQQWGDIMDGITAQNVLTQVHRYIEEYGTGGAIFRQLYRSFLAELLEHPDVTGDKAPRAWAPEEITLVSNVLPVLDVDIAAWNTFAGHLKGAVDDWGTECLTHLNLEDLAGGVEHIAQLEQEIFTRLSKLKL